MVEWSVRKGMVEEGKLGQGQRKMLGITYIV